MKKNTLELIVDSLRFERHEIIIPEEVRLRAAAAFEKMFLMTDPVITQPHAKELAAI